MIEDELEGFKYLKDVDVTDEEYNNLLNNLAKADEVHNEFLKKCQYKKS